MRPQRLAMTDMIVHQLKRNGGELTRTELWRSISSWRNAEVKPALAELKRTGLVVEQRRLGRSKRIRSVLTYARDDEGKARALG